MTRQTIAIAGAERTAGSVIAQKLAALNQYRLLIVSETEDPIKDLPGILQQNPESDLEQVHCYKDGCWEADIIILDIPFAGYCKVAEKIKEVSTQKIVLILSGEQQQGVAAISPEKKWQDLLPNAKVVVAWNPFSGNGTRLTGTDKESLNTIAEILEKLESENIIKK